MHTFKRNWQLFTVVAGFLIVFGLIYGLRRALLPFLVGFVVVHITEPAVAWVERRFPRGGFWSRKVESRRVVSILAVNTAILLAIGGFAFYAFNVITNSISLLLQNATEHWLQAVSILQNWTGFARDAVPVGVRGEIDVFISNLGATITQSIRTQFTQQVTQIPGSFSAVLGLAILPFFVFYMLKDREKLSRAFYAGLPPWAAEYAGHIFGIIEDVLGRYIRATVTLGGIVGAMNLVGLILIGAPAAPLLAVVAGVTEMIPTLGPWIGGAVATVVTLALAPDKVVLVLALALGVQVLENNLLVPRIQSGFLGLHPAITILVLVVGSAVGGMWGMLLGVPLTATAVQVWHYVRTVMNGEDVHPPEKHTPDVATT